MSACRLDNLRAQRVSAGHSIARLAKLATVSDAIIVRLESPSGALRQGGTTTPLIADRICAALNISRATAGFTELG